MSCPETTEAVSRVPLTLASLGADTPHALSEVVCELPNLRLSERAE